MQKIIAFGHGHGSRQLASLLLAGAMLAPSFVQAQTLGVVEQRLDRIEGAVKKLQENEADRHTRRANSQDAYLQLSRRLDALERTISNVVSIQERDHRDLAVALEQLQRVKGDLEARLDELEKQPQAAPQEGMQLRPGAEAASADDRFAQAMAYATSQDWVKAEFAFDAFVASYPTDARIPEARYQLGLAFHRQGKYAQAAQIFLNLFEQHSDAPFAIANLFALADALSAMGPASTQQACDVYGEIEAAHGSDLSVDQRSRLLDRRLSLKCSN